MQQIQMEYDIGCTLRSKTLECSTDHTVDGALMNCGWNQREKSSPMTTLQHRKREAKDSAGIKFEVAS